MRYLAITVRGHVQGVGFRAAAQKRAKNLGIVGFAKNTPERSVYLEAFGEQPALEEFLLWCNKGPSAATVVSVESEWDGARGGDFTEFSVL